MSRFSFSLKDAASPPAAVEISAHRVSAALVENRGGRPVVAAHATESLPAEMVVPSLTGSNIRDLTGVTAALRRTLERIGRPRRVALVLPDAVAKVSLVRFERVPVILERVPVVPLLVINQTKVVERGSLQPLVANITGNVEAAGEVVDCFWIIAHVPED